MEKIGTAVFVFMIAFLAFVGGAMAILTESFPYEFLNNAYRAGEALRVQQEIIDNPIRTNLYQPARTSARGVTVYDRERASPGYTLYTSGHDNTVRLIALDGRVVHEWTRPFSDVWNEQADVKEPQPDPLIFSERARLYPNGDILVVYISSADTPWGYGMAKLDRDSNVIWSYLAHVHHDMSITPDNRIITLTHEFQTVRPNGAEQLDQPYLEDFIVVLSPEGVELQKISLTQALLRSRYADLFRMLPYFALGDPLHTNTAEYIDAEEARNFPFAEEGDVLVSFRELSLIAVLSMQTGEINWAARGAWLQQHDPTIMANGDILLFDNFGAQRPGNSSRVLQVDPTTLNVKWSYAGTEERPFHSAIRSSAQRLRNGNTLITESDGGRMFEVTMSGDIVWEFINPARAGAGDRLIPVVNAGQRVRPEDLTPQFRKLIEQNQQALMH